MKEWWTMKPILVELFVRHFPDATDSEIEKHTYNVSDLRDLGESMEYIQRSQKSPKGDINKLASVAKKLNQAADLIADIGWAGNSAINEMSVDLQKRLSIKNLSPHCFRHSNAWLSEFLKELATGFQQRANSIDPEVPYNKRVFGLDGVEPKTRGAPNKTEAEYTARAAYDAFAALKGKTPTVITNRETNTAGGPFLELVEDVFRVYEIDASAEKMARMVCKDNNTGKN